jgi:hypothetical protein
MLQIYPYPFFMKNTSISHLLATTTSQFWDLCNAGNDFLPPCLLGDLNIAWLQPNANLLTYVRDRYNQKPKFYLGGTICVLFTIAAPPSIFQIQGCWWRQRITATTKERGGAERRGRRALMAAADHSDNERARRSWAEGEEGVDGGFAAHHGIIDHLPSRVSPSKIAQ